MASSEFEYLLQLFVTFAPRPELQPLLLRVTESATVEAAIAVALERISTVAGDVLPSSTPSHFALCHALGDGSVDPGSAEPLAPRCVIRDAQLAFPYMLAIVHVGEDRREEESWSTRRTSSREARTQLAAELSAAEREAATQRREALEAKRAENIERIEEKRSQVDLDRFHRAESHELQRRETAEERRQSQLRAQRAAEEEEIEAAARAEEAAKRAQAAQQAEVEAHKRRMLELKDAETARLNAVSEAQAAHEAALREAKERAAEQRRLEREATKMERMESSLQSLVSCLDETVVQSKELEVSVARNQFAARAEAARTAKQLKDVQMLEQQRAEERASLRDRRTAEAQIEEERRRLAAVQLEEERAQKREAEEKRFAEWKAAQESQIAEVSGLLELQLRTKRAGTSSTKVTR